jgi:nucleoid DNA-binding protein
MARLQDTLIKTTAIKLAIPERIVEAVVNHQFASANTALASGENMTVEISGFGKFIFSKKKAIKRLEKLQQNEIDLQDQIDHPEKLKRDLLWTKNTLTATKRIIRQLKPIVDEFQADIRGVEK